MKILNKVKELPKREGHNKGGRKASPEMIELVKKIKKTRSSEYVPVECENEKKARSLATILTRKGHFITRRKNIVYVVGELD